MLFQYHDRNFAIRRYPTTADRSLQAWSAADEHILKLVEETKLSFKAPAIYGDRFGFLSCVLYHSKPIISISHKSQHKAVLQNARANNLVFEDEQFCTPLSPLPRSIDLGMIKIPKSLDLFTLFLHQLTRHLDDNGIVICAFMTRHFSEQMLSVAGDFFQSVEQSRAWKKSRLLILKNKKPLVHRELVNSLQFEEQEFTQYFGVFSGNAIDYASQFLIKHLTVTGDEKRVLDLASGNGVLAVAARKKLPECELHLLDDSFLAIESSKMNVTGENIFFHYNNTLNEFGDDVFDLILCNPPFHFEHENTIDIALALFKGAKRCLKHGGRMLVVANRHLNYKTHLDKLFKTTILAENDKFIVYNCSK